MKVIATTNLDRMFSPDHRINYGIFPFPSPSEEWTQDTWQAGSLDVIPHNVADPEAASASFQICDNC